MCYDYVCMYTTIILAVILTNNVRAWMFSCLGDEFSLLIDQTLIKILLAIEIPANTSWCLKYNVQIFLRDQEVPHFQIITCKICYIGPLWSSQLLVDWVQLSFTISCCLTLTRKVDVQPSFIDLLPFCNTQVFLKGTWAILLSQCGTICSMFKSSAKVWHFLNYGLFPSLTGGPWGMLCHLCKPILSRACIWMSVWWWMWRAQLCKLIHCLLLQWSCISSCSN